MVYSQQVNLYAKAVQWYLITQSTPPLKMNYIDFFLSSRHKQATLKSLTDSKAAHLSHCWCPTVMLYGATKFRRAAATGNKFYKHFLGNLGAQGLPNMTVNILRSLLLLLLLLNKQHWDTFLREVSFRKVILLHAGKIWKAGRQGAREGKSQDVQRSGGSI